MKKYICTDGNGDTAIEANSPREAAQEWVDTADWGNEKKTQWIDVYVTGEDGEREKITITLQPTAPQCGRDKGTHDWVAPYSLLGGLHENPGVSGHGGGVRITEICRCCGCYKVKDTYAQRSDTGEQGLQSTEYRDADADSKAWLTAQQTKWEQWVRDNITEVYLPDDKLERAFVAIFRRLPDDYDREQGLWSHLCAEVSAE